MGLKWRSSSRKNLLLWLGCVRTALCGGSFILGIRFANVSGLSSMTLSGTRPLYLCLWLCVYCGVTYVDVCSEGCEEEFTEVVTLVKSMLLSVYGRLKFCAATFIQWDKCVYAPLSSMAFGNIRDTQLRCTLP